MFYWTFDHITFIWFNFNRNIWNNGLIFSKAKRDVTTRKNWALKITSLTSRRNILLCSALFSRLFSWTIKFCQFISVERSSEDLRILVINEFKDYCLNMFTNLMWRNICKSSVDIYLSGTKGWIFSRNSRITRSKQ